MELEKKIAIDIDGVLLDFLPTLNDFFNQNHNKTRRNFFPEDYSHYDLNLVWGVSKQEVIEIVNSFYFSEFFWRIPALSFAEEGVQRLIKQDYELFVVTSRPSTIRERTEEQLRRFFGNSFSEIHFNGQYGVASSLMDKSDFCLSRGIPFVFEDNFEIAQTCSEKGIRVYLFHYPYNNGRTFYKEQLNTENIIRVGIHKPHWKGVLTCFESKNSEKGN